jgi:hypothetical protein
MTIVQLQLNLWQRLEQAQAEPQATDWRQLCLAFDVAIDQTPVGLRLVTAADAIEVMLQGALNSIDWHAHRGLSFLQIGLRRINQLCYQRLPLPPLRHLPRCNPPPAYASLKKRDAMNTRIEFAKVTVF